MSDIEVERARLRRIVDGYGKNNVNATVKPRQDGTAECEVFFSGVVIARFDILSKETREIKIKWPAPTRT